MIKGGSSVRQPQTRQPHRSVPAHIYVVRNSDEPDDFEKFLIEHERNRREFDEAFEAFRKKIHDTPCTV